MVVTRSEVRRSFSIVLILRISNTVIVNLWDWTDMILYSYKVRLYASAIRSLLYTRYETKPMLDTPLPIVYCSFPQETGVES